jgi:NTE family protein
MQNYLTDIALEKYPPDIIIKVGRNAADTFDFFKAKELIAFGEGLAAKALDEYESNN